MRLPPFALEEWISRHTFGSHPASFNLAHSTGPAWTVRELEQLRVGTLDTGSVELTYAPPEGGSELRQAIAEYLHVDPSWVVVTTGASEALLLAFSSVAEAKGTLVLPTPAFPVFAAVARSLGLEIAEYSLDANTGFAQPASIVLEAVGEGTAAALVNTPHNPTGSVMARSEVELLAQELALKSVPLLVDEVYHPIYHSSPQRSAAGLPNVICIGDMSKALSLPGVRIGWLVDRDDERRKTYTNSRSYWTLGSSPLAEEIAIHALRNREEILSRTMRVASENRTALAASIERMSEFVGWVPPQGGMTAFPWLRNQRDSRQFCESMAHRGVVVVPGDCFASPNHVRIGLGGQPSEFRQALAVIEEAMAVL